MRLEVKKATEAEPEPVMTLELVQQEGIVHLRAHLPDGRQRGIADFDVKDGKVYAGRYAIPAEYFHINKMGLICCHDSEDHA